MWGTLLLGVGLIFSLCVSLVATRSHARVQPYYVLTGASFNQIKPRILLVFDTSDSMGIVAADDKPLCPWNECEAPGAAGESRMSVTRRSIRAVVTELRQAADFSFMTFDQYEPLEAPAVLPPKCPYTGVGGDRRFFFADVIRSRNPDGTPRTDPLVRYTDPDTGSGYPGTWVLCSGKENPGVASSYVEHRPWPYIARTELGVGQVAVSGISTTANVAPGDPLPPSPLISVREADLKDPSNAHRRVQWLPRFMGLRTNLAAFPAVASASVGDYTAAEVSTLDFYYWPYVDGFAGYSWWSVRTTDPGYSDPNYRPGVVAGRGLTTARLYQPFYIDPATLAASGVAPADYGPAAASEALDGVLALTDTGARGGVDANSRDITPWRSVLGTPGAATMTNDYGSHTTVASYLDFLTNMDPSGVCNPIGVVLLTDGFPLPAATEGGSGLYGALSNLRLTYDIDIRVVGVFQPDDGQLNAMACAAAGGCPGGVACADPCAATPPGGWDTCEDPANPATNCVYLANTAEDLTDKLRAAFESMIGDNEVATGTGSAVNDFGSFGSGPDDPGVRQTRLNAFTEYPQWRGHVVRELCDDTIVDEFGATVLAPWCAAPSSPPSDESTFGGPCPPSWTWDAGACLASAAWAERPVYSHDASNNLVRLYNPSANEATQAFVDLLNAEGLLAGLPLLNALGDPASDQEKADQIAEFVLGKDRPWRLPGLANSAPIVVRRVPKHDPEAVPAVPIADAHCGGRNFSDSGAEDLPTDLVTFAKDAWDDTNRTFDSLSGTYAFHYQEAVVVGDDMGVLHGFQLQSGNELWGLVPRFVWPQVLEQLLEGPANQGQPRAIEDHIYGVASTLNQGWVWDAGASRWRHLGILGLGRGGTEYIALDLSHMNPEAPTSLSPKCNAGALEVGGCPLEVLWTTEDAGLKADYDANLAETWARPALAYDVPGNSMSAHPQAMLVLGGGYRNDRYASATGKKGRVLMTADAVTGALERSATMNYPIISRLYEPDYAQIADPVVTTHCLSKFWPEMQEAYFATPGGRILRWDLEHRLLPSSKRSDSGGVWIADGVTNGTTQRLGPGIFACRGVGATCAVGSAGDKFAPFIYPPAVTANDRIDPLGDPGADAPPNPDEFLIALISGSPYEDTLDGGDPANDFHSDIILMVDDHSADPNGGVVVPASQAKTPTLGSDPKWARLALSDIQRTRTFTPFPGATEYVETRAFLKGARPARAPRIEVSTVIGADGSDDLFGRVEIFTLTFVVYEPPPPYCDTRFHDATNDVWYRDAGSSYVITLRLTADTASGFDFSLGSQRSDVDFGAGFERGLTLVSVEQIRGGDCADGVCPPKVGDVGTKPCEFTAPVAGAAAGPPRTQSVTTAAVRGFSPTE